jgi:uncharacterized protein (DUF1800 family)
MTHRGILARTLVLGAVLAGSTLGAAGIPKDKEAVEHALNRLAYGPKPGDVERVQEMGLSNWIDRQLHPDGIDDSALKARLPEQPERPAQFADQMEARRWGRQSVQALSAEKVVRAVYSDRQLEEQLVDFWFNHFNVFAGKGRTSEWIADYERHAIRPHVFGKFRDLLEATAKSPAMLFYLDNWLSADPAAAERQQELQQQRAARLGVANPNRPQPQGQQRRRGLNENYGRELLELHTLGVDGGYTQKDIIEVARAFTGWTIAPQNQKAARQPGVPFGARGRRPQLAPGAVQEGEFRFTPMLHDSGEKIVLGHKIKAGGGIEDGEQVLDIVARHPATAHHIAFELAQRFVSDEPPKALVDRAAKKFRDTDGDLREVVKTIITSDEFFSARGAKVKTPLEFLASAMRATGRDMPGDGRQLLNALMQMGMPLYMCQPPTGYDDTAETWVSAGALVARMNIAQRIAGPQQATSIGGPEFQRR